MTLTRRQALNYAMVGTAIAAMPSIAAPRKPVVGRILGLSTLDPADGWTEISSLVELDLLTGAIDYHDIGPYKFGHSLLRLPGGGYYATPYGDDQMSALFVDEKFRITNEVKAPRGHSYGGHSVLLPDNKHIFGLFIESLTKRSLIQRIPGELIYWILHPVLLSTRGPVKYFTDMTCW